MRSEQFFFCFFLLLLFVFVSQLSEFSLRKIVKNVVLEKNLNLLKLSYPRYRFVKVDNSNWRLDGRKFSKWIPFSWQNSCFLTTINKNLSWTSLDSSTIFFPFLISDQLKSSVAVKQNFRLTAFHKRLFGEGRKHSANSGTARFWNIWQKLIKLAVLSTALFPTVWYFAVIYAHAVGDILFAKSGLTLHLPLLTFPLNSYIESRFYARLLCNQCALQ